MSETRKVDACMGGRHFFVTVAETTQEGSLLMSRPTDVARAGRPGSVRSSLQARDNRDKL